MTLRERIEALTKVWEQREKESGLLHPGLSELRALLAEAEEPPGCPWCKRDGRKLSAMELQWVCGCGYKEYYHDAT
jgi:uncharacterized protein YabN with tetrapyrrole methylase and pyrophosphatase domain